MNKKKIDTSREKAAELVYDLTGEHFAEVEDYRRIASTDHLLSHVLFITLCASISGADNLKAVAEYAKDMSQWFSSFLGLSNGVPSYGTFWQVFK